jgi:dolichyl-phosphate beta-glucosyltransferase
LPGFIDTQCGFKAYKADVAREVFSRARLDGFCFDVEVLAIAVHRGHRVIEVPVEWRDDPRSKVNPVTDSLDMFLDLFRIRANRNRGLYD